MACAAPLTGKAFLGAVLGYIDCQAQTMGGFGYQSLASPQSSVSIAMASLLTIFVALIGLRMLLGRSFDVRDGVVAVAKIGIVLVMATSWPAVRTVLYDVVFQGPAEISGSIANSSALVSDGLASRLQRVDDAMLALTKLGTGRNELSPVDGGAPSPAIADNLALGLGRTAFLASTIGATALVRLSAGILLALAPIFAGLLLFGFMRGVFIGWLRGLGAAALAGVALALVLATELALLEPWLTDVLARRTARLPTFEAPIELMVLTVGFAVALFGLFTLIARVSFMVDIPAAHWGGSKDRHDGGLQPSVMAPRRADPIGRNDSSRALLVADAVAAVQRRETLQAIGGSGASGAHYGNGAGSTVAMVGAATGPGAGRRTQARVSQGARKRDARS